MAKIIDKQEELMARTKLLGKKYVGCKNVPGLWNEWFSNNMFDPFDKEDNDDDSYIGLMKWKLGKEREFEYWIGKFVGKDFIVDGYEELIIETNKVYTYYIKGQDGPELYAKEGECYTDFASSKHELFIDKDGYCYCFERYNCPRFTIPDENNEVILDYAFIIK